MAKLRITPNGIVLESEIIISGETLIRLTNPENAKRIKAALLDFGKVSHRIEESDKNVSIMSHLIDNKLLHFSDAPLYFLEDEDIIKQIEEIEKNHNEFIKWAQSLPAPTPTIDFKDEEDEDVENLVNLAKQVLDDDPVTCKVDIIYRKGSYRKGSKNLFLRGDRFKMLLNAFIEKYGKEKESL